MIRLATALLFLALAPEALAQCTTSWTNASGGAWTDGASWDNGVPGVTDDACITLDGTYTVTVGTFAVNSLTLGDVANTGTQTLQKGSGAFSVVAASAIEASGVLNWQNGNFTSGTITNRGLITLTGSGGSRGVYSGTGTLRNEGTVEHLDTTPFYLYGTDSRVENAGLWDIQTDGDISGAGGTMSVFANEATGTLRKSAGGGLTTVGGAPIVFENAGTVEAATGEIRFDRPSTHTAATFTTASGATIRFNTGGITFVGTQSGAQAGALILNTSLTAGAGATWAFTGEGVQWQNGYLGTGTLVNTNLVRFSGGGGSRGVNSASGATFRNEGTVEHVDGTPFYVTGDDARAENAALWDIQTDADLSAFSGAMSMFTNEAASTFRKSGGTGITSVGGASFTFENAGTVEAATGEIRFDRPSTHTAATFTTASGATIRFNTGGITFVGTQSGAQAGALILNTSLTAGAGATWAFTGEGVQWQNGYLGTGTLVNTNLVRFSGGGGSRGVNSASGATFRNEGTVEHVDGTPFYVTGDDARAENAALWDIQTDADLSAFTGTMSVFVNETAGTIRKSGGTGITSVGGAPLVFQNDGTVDSATGEIRFDRPNVHTAATFTTASGATIRFSTGGVTFVGTTTGEQLGTLQLDDLSTGGTDAVLAFSGTGLRWQDGYLGTGTLTNAGLVRLDGGGGNRGVNSGSGATFRNEGTVEHLDTTPFYVTGDDARVENAGLWDIQTDADLTAFSGTMSVFVNEATGTLQKSAGTGITVLGAANFSFENAGQVSVLSGEMDVNRPFDHQAGGQIGGTGTFDVSGSAFTFGGDVGPGASPGILSWQTAYAPEATSTLRVELGGTAPGTEHDQLVASGAATLDGALELDVTAGLSVGDTFTILTASSVTGAFSDVVASGLPGYAFSVTVNPTDVVVEVTSVSTPLTLNGRAGWRTLTTPFVNLPLGGRPTFPGLLEPTYTAGYVGADLDQRNRRGRANVFFYDEPTGAFVVPDDAGPIASGVGFWFYAFIDDDPRTPGSQGAFPKVLTSSCAGCVEEALPFSFPISYTASAPSGPNDPGPGMNLVGNPIATDLDWDDPAWTRTNVSDVLYIYDPRFDDGDPGYAGGWRTWNGTTGTLPTEGRIPVGQGFHIEATGPDPILTAPASAKLPTQSPLYRLTGDAPGEQASKATVPQIRLSASGEIDGRQRRAEAFVTFEPGAALGFDRRDARALAGRPGADALRIYTYLGAAHGVEAGSAFQVSVLPTDLFDSESPFEIEMGAEALASGVETDATVTLEWEAADLPEGWTADLVDRDSGQRWSVDEPGQADLQIRAGAGLTASDLDLGPSDTEVDRAIEDAIARGEEPPPAPAPVARALRVPLAPSGRPAKAGSDRFVLVFSPEAEEPVITQTVVAAPVPNPTRGTARLALQLAEETDLRVVLYDVLGRQVAVAQEGVLASGGHVVTLRTEGLAPGSYVVRVEGGTWAETRRLTVAR